MDDFTYDCVVKKRIANGDRHRKRGSKSKKCTLGSDYMTDAQWRKKNGACKSMNLDKPIDWKSFKEWPADIGREYIQRLVDTYHCTIKDLAEFFDVTPPPVRRYLGQVNFPMSQFQKGHRMRDEDRESLMQWKLGIESEIDQPEPACEIAEIPAVQEVQEPVREIPTLMMTPHLEMDFVGMINPQQITNTLLAVAGQRKVHLRVIVDECKEERETVCTT